MKNRCLVAALILVIAINVLVLAGAAWNRTGEPDAVVSLTERELSTGYGELEDSGIYLRLVWHHGTLDWFDATKLRSIGYDTSIQPGSENAERFYRKALPRRTYVVLEYEGNAWAKWIKAEEEKAASMERKVSQRQATEKQIDEARKSLESKKTAATRLFPVDVGNDPRVLRSRYPERNRYIIASAEVRLSYDDGTDHSTGTKKAPTIHGQIDTVLVSEIAVPRTTASPILKLVREGRGPQRSGYPEYMDGGPKAPRFRAVVTFGRRYEPWVVSVAPL